jgi:hypothetical protein
LGTGSCEKPVAKRRLGQGCCRLPLNYSPAQFRHDDLPGVIHAILMETGLAAPRLELEMTENALIDDFPRALSILRRLKSLGVRIAMDDFGAGYSSLWAEGCSCQWSPKASRQKKTRVLVGRSVRRDSRLLHWAPQANPRARPNGRKTARGAPWSPRGGAVI